MRHPLLRSLPSFGIALGIALTSACKPPRTVALASPDLPDQVELVAVLGWDSAGLLVHSSGLIRRTPAMPTYLLEKDAQSIAAYDVLGWPAAQIAAAGAPANDDLLFRDALRPAASADPFLPAPIFSERFDPARNAGGEARAPMPLTADWLPRCGAEPAQENSGAEVDVSCADKACYAAFAEHACGIEIDLGGACALGKISGAYDGQRQLSLTQAGAFQSCTVAAPRPPASISLACTKADGTACKVEVYPPPFADFAATASVTVPHGSKHPAPSDAFPRMPSGYIAGLELVGGRVLAVQHDTFSSWPDCDGQPSTLDFIDPETMAVVMVKPTVPCMVQIARDPIGRGFIGAFGGATHQIGRFDENGAMTAQASVTLAGLVGRHRVSAMAIAASPQALVVLFSEEYNDVDLSTKERPILAALDARDFSVMSSVVIPAGLLEEAGTAGPMAILEDGSIAVAEPSTETVYVYAWPGLGPKTNLEIRQTCTETRGFAEATMFTPAGTSELFLSGVDPDTSTAFSAPYPALSPCRRINFYPFAASLFDQAPWKGGLLLAGLGAQTGHRAYLALLDPAGERFLPATMPIGLGPPAYFRSDGNRVFLALPWTGTIVRATPK